MQTLSYQELTERYQAMGPHPKWHAQALERIRQVQDLSETALALPENQRLLWARSQVFFLGYSENIDTEPLVQSPQVVAALCALRSREWSPDLQARAEEIQATYDSLLELVHPLVETKPSAKLHRAFLMLLPRELHFGLNGKISRGIYRKVVGSKHAGVGRLQGAVLARGRLRAVLGSEDTLAEHVRRSIFLVELSQEQPPEPQALSKEPPLELWPISRQVRGIPNFSNWMGLLQDTVGAAWEPIHRDELIEVLREDRGHSQAPQTLRGMLRMALLFGLLKKDGPLLVADEDKAEELLSEQTPDFLIQAVLERVYGTAHILRLSADQPRQTAQICAWFKQTSGWEHVASIYSMARRLRELGLITLDPAGEGHLTPSGQRWSARLPKALPILPAPKKEQEASLEGQGAEWPALSTLLQRFETDPELKPFVFSSQQILELHTAWHFHKTKRFALLSGLSGTGKTALLTHYARVFCEQVGCDPDQHLAVVAVRPDWRDPSGLLGYLNALHSVPTFQVEPALRLVLDAVDNPGLPYFLVLDEMNLARVERYFAPFLSAMESPEGRLDLHAEAASVNEIPPWVRWPANLFIGGTVNMDESTHAFSDKVLDRAFTLEFWEVDLPRLFSRRPHRDPALESLLLALYETLLPLRRHFGYRSASEVLDWVQAARAASPQSPQEQLWDAAVFSKVLPKLRGTESPQLSAALSALGGIFETHNMTRCEQKMRQMKARLESTGVTGFWS